MKFSSSFKVGLLTLIALILLVGIVFKVKGRTFSSAERIEVQFQDVNGMRPGAGVQMMGIRVGQVEQVQPVINGDKSHVNVKFVITEPDISIPKASMFSIQQTGLIGELFLEITPPKRRTIYVPVNNYNFLAQNDFVQMKLDDKYYNIGEIIGIEVVSRDAVPFNMKEIVKTNHAYKIDYIVDLPGLVLPEFLKGQVVKDHDLNKLRISALDDVILPYPKQNSPYTIIEPMRIADFMDWQYKAAESLTETNRKINELLSDEVIAELKMSAANINSLTAQTSSTMTKINELIESSKGDIEQMMAMMDQASKDFNSITANINGLIGDAKFKTTVYSAAESVEILARSLNKILGNDEEAQQLADDLRAITRNINEISTYVNSLTKDEQLKKDLTGAVNNINNAMCGISKTLAAVNKMTPESKTEIQKIIEETSSATSNLKKFSEKLNKRFLLFRLIF